MAGRCESEMKLRETRVQDHTVHSDGRGGHRPTGWPWGPPNRPPVVQPHSPTDPVGIGFLSRQEVESDVI